MMYRDNLQVILKSEFIEKLKQNLDYMLAGGTDFRIKTAELSLEIATAVENPDVFSNRQSATEYVKQFLCTEDQERCIDVSESLFHNHRDLYLQKNLSEKIQAELVKRKQKRNLVFNYVLSDGSTTKLNLKNIKKQVNQMSFTENDYEQTMISFSVET